LRRERSTWLPAPTFTRPLRHLMLGQGASRSEGQLFGPSQRDRLSPSADPEEASCWTAAGPGVQNARSRKERLVGRRSHADWCECASTREPLRDLRRFSARTSRVLSPRTPRKHDQQAPP
jgi:hypothetical protein